MGSKLGSGSGGPEQGSSSSSNNSSLTTFVQTDPCTFRALVQKLTGADHGHESSSSSSSPHLSNSRRLPATSSSSTTTTTHGVLHLVGPRRSAFKIQERRLLPRKNNLNMMRMRMIRNLKHQLEINQPITTPTSCHPISVPIPKNNSHLVPNPIKLAADHDHDHDDQIISPVSTLDPLFLSTSTSPNTPTTPSIVANNHHPQLLPLFPLHSPKHYSPS